MRTIYESRETHLNMFYIGDCPDRVSGWCQHVEPRFVFELSISSRYVSRHPVSDWGMYLTNQNTASGSKPQCSVCISPSRILHQALPTHGMYLTSTISPTRNGYHTQRGPTPSVGSVLNRCVLTEWGGERCVCIRMYTLIALHTRRLCSKYCKKCPIIFRHCPNSFWSPPLCFMFHRGTLKRHIRMWIKKCVYTSSPKQAMPK